ncbi:MAG TPA: 23S rRNA (pseudouridine(1915)-N(3))-methyltransferase RlmH, partial [candidate division Zixibacteria bacterium]|nr:23S rRNA (pseudouridine(1915)-N(3))-methyltransferase RlmH [candidate division Zixibacteria bacterium]
AEAERQLKRINSRHRVVALDMAGAADTSEEFAERLGRWQSLAPGVDVLLGGAFGLGAAALERADETISLSSLTLSHQVARIVALEQLYRGFSILSGSPYHK